MKVLRRLKIFSLLSVIIVFLQLIVFLPTQTIAATVGIDETDFSSGTLTGVAGGVNSLQITNPGTPTFSRASTAFKEDGSSVASGASRFENRSVNLIKNNSFETDSNADGLADNWENVVGSGGDVSRVRTNSLSPGIFNGSRSQKVQIVSSTNAGAEVIRPGPNSYIPVEAGNTYTFSAYVKANIANKVFLVVRLWDSNLTSELSVDAYSSYLDVANQMKRLTATVTVPTGLVQAELHIRGINTAGEWMEMDAAQFEQSPVATPYVPSNRGQAIRIEEGTTNLISADSSSFENTNYNWTFFNDGGGTGTWGRTLGNAHSGSYSGRVANLGIAQPMHIVTPLIIAPSKTYTFSVYTKHASNLGQWKVAIEYKDSSFNLLARSDASWTATDTNYSRLSLTAPAPANTYYAYFYIYRNTMNNSEVFYFDDAQVEEKPYATSFITGGQTRQAEMLYIPTLLTVKPQEGTFETWVNVNDGIKNMASHREIFGVGDNDNSPIGNTIILQHTVSNTWQFVTSDVNKINSSISTTDNLSKGWHHFAVRWSQTEIALFIDGVKKGSAANPKIPSSLNSNLYIGSWKTGGLMGNTQIDDIKISTLARGDAEILADYNASVSGQSQPVDEFTSYKLDLDNNFNIGKGGYRVSPPINISVASPVTPAQSSVVNWTALLNGGRVDIDAQLSLDGGATWGNWFALSNGNPIPNIDSLQNLSNARLKFRQKLAIDNRTAGTPNLQNISFSLNTEAPLVTLSLSTSNLNLSVDPAILKSDTKNIDITVTNNVFGGNYAVYVKEDKQPINGTTPLPYISGGAGQASGFITHGGTTKGYGYTVKNTGGSPIISTSFNNGSNYTSFNTIDEQIMSGGKTDGDKATVTIGSFVDYSVPSGAYNNILTFSVVPVY